MRRRGLLAGVGGLVGLSGCTGVFGGSGSSSDPSAYETVSVDGIDVPLAPLDDVHDWFEADQVRFADARSRGQYERSHIESAVHSPAPDGLDQDDPVEPWPTDARIVTYCGCPHHLSSMRAASLIGDGYVRAYALDEGFWAWVDAGHPVAGDDTDARPALRRIRGRSDPAHGGESAWARHPPTRQREATRIAADGGYVLDLRFAGVTADSTIEVETPAYRLEAPLGRLTDGVVTPP